MVIQSYLVHRSRVWHRDGRFIELCNARIPRRDFQRRCWRKHTRGYCFLSRSVPPVLLVSPCRPYKRFYRISTQFSPVSPYFYIHLVDVRTVVRLSGMSHILINPLNQLPNYS